MTLTGLGCIPGLISAVNLLVSEMIKTGLDLDRKASNDSLVKDRTAD